MNFMITVSINAHPDIEDKINNYVKENNINLNQVMLDLILEKIEDEEDYKLAVEAYEEYKLNKEKAISFRGSVYYQSSSTLEMMKKRKKFISYHEFKDIGNYSLNRIIYVDDKYKLVLYLENFTGGGSGSDGGKYLGLKFWFDYITGCERLVQGLQELDEQYLSIYREKTLWQTNTMVFLTMPLWQNPAMLT